MNALMSPLMPYARQLRPFGQAMILCCEQAVERSQEIFGITVPAKNGLIPALSFADKCHSPVFDFGLDQFFAIRAFITSTSTVPPFVSGLVRQNRAGTSCINQFSHLPSSQSQLLRAVWIMTRSVLSRAALLAPRLQKSQAAVQQLAHLLALPLARFATTRGFATKQEAWGLQAANHCRARTAEGVKTTFYKRFLSWPAQEPFFV
jgi:hypothetical protein